MTKFILGAAVSALALAATAAHADQPATAAHADQPATPATASSTTAKPTYGSYGFDESGMDMSVKPGDDFYDYANGTWAKNPGSFPMIVVSSIRWRS